MIYGSVCSGIEAATVAWHGLGWRAAWYADIDPFARAVLAHRYPEVLNLGDFTAIRGHWLRRIGATPIELLVGGTPCQSFSVAGRREGLDDARGNLTLEFLGLARRLRPRWLVWENVPGVLSIDGGRTFGAILGTLAELGYGFAYRVLDAQFFGVPQRRRRVFVVACAGNWRAPAAVLFERESLRRDLAPRRREKAGTPAAAEVGPTGGRFTDIAPTLDARCKDGPIRNQIGLVAFHDVSPAVSAKWAKGSGGPSGDECQNLTVAFSCKDDGRDAAEGVTPTLRAMPHDASHANGGGQLAVAFRAFGQDGFAAGPIAPPVLSSDGGGVASPVVFEARFARNGRGAPDDVVPPLKAHSGTTSKGDGAPLLAWRLAVRRLTPRECERLQGFPDDWTLNPTYRYRIDPQDIDDIAAYLGISIEQARQVGATPDGPRYKAIGNSMAVPVMRWIGERIETVDAILREAA